MLIPMNFVVGAIAGAAVAYVYKDEPTKKALGSTGAKLKGLFTKKTETVEEVKTADAESTDVADKKVNEAEAVTEKTADTSVKS